MSTDLRLILSILLDAVSDRLGSIVGTDEHCMEAIEIILKKTEPSKDIIDFVAERLLQIFQQNREGGDYVLYKAGRIVKLGASKITAEKVLRESIKFLGRT